MQKKTWYLIVGVTLFGIGFGFVEAAIVKYLRVIFYGGGFEFPLQGFVDPELLSVEWIREFWTIVMLLGVGIAAGRTHYERFAFFLVGFAVWDIFYYLSLKYMLDWPASLLTWDILFLIPWPWVGPVIAPVIYALGMLGLAGVIIYWVDKGEDPKMNWKEWTWFLAASCIVLYTFIYDYGKILIQGGYLKDYFALAEDQAFLDVVNVYVPTHFMWGIFLVGIACMIVPIVTLHLRMRKTLKAPRTTKK